MALAAHLHHPLVGSRPSGRCGRYGSLTSWAFWAALIGFGAAPADAQSVRGTLLEEGSLRPIPGAIVSLLDEAGTKSTATLSDDRGGFVLRASAPGRYRVQAERIGFVTTTSPALVLEGSSAVEYRMVVANEAIELGGVSVTTTGRSCQVRPGEGAPLYRVWEEARKALTSTALSQAETLRLRLDMYSRSWDPTGRSLQEESTWTEEGWSRTPFATLSPEDLARGGYVRQVADSITYYGPDAAVLLSDAFLDTHCFRLTEREEGGISLVGLAFEPIPQQRVPDIEGVLWLDRESSELKYVEYRYTRLPVSDSTLGGRIELERTPAGHWIVRRWSIRMPVVVTENVRGPTGIPTQRTRLAGIQEAGGEAVQITASARRIEPAGAALSGTVLDTGLDLPLADATVYLSGTSYAATTSQDGRFTIEGIRPGSYRVGFSHPVLDSIGSFPPLVELELREGDSESVELSLPANYLAIQGRVTDSDGTPVPAAEVTLLAASRRTTTSASGHFRFFGVRPGTHELEVRYPGLEPQRIAVDVGQAVAATVELALDFRPIALPGVEVTADARQRPGAMGGYTISAEDVARIRPNTFVDLFRAVPGVSIRRGGDGSEIVETTALSLRLNANWGQQQLTPEPARVGAGADPEVAPRTLDACPMLVFVDGVFAQPQDLTLLLNQIRISSIDEIYLYARAGTVPAQYRRPGSECGVIAVWTKPGV